MHIIKSLECREKTYHVCLGRLSELLTLYFRWESCQRSVSVSSSHNIMKSDPVNFGGPLQYCQLDESRLYMVPFKWCIKTGHWRWERCDPPYIGRQIIFSRGANSNQIRELVYLSMIEWGTNSYVNCVANLIVFKRNMGSKPSAAEMRE